MSSFFYIHANGNNLIAQKGKFGIRAGTNYSSFSGVLFKEGFEEYFKFGFQAGAVYSYEVNRYFTFQPGLYLVEKGGKDETFINMMHLKGRVNVNYSPYYLEMPILLSFRDRISENWKFQVNMGLYVAYGLFEKISS